MRYQSFMIFGTQWHTCRQQSPKVITKYINIHYVCLSNVITANNVGPIILMELYII